MPCTIEVKASDAAVKTQRRMLAQRVTDYFGLSLPDSRLLCFLDDEAQSSVGGDLGPANRALYMPIHDMADLEGWPNYVRNCIYPRPLRQSYSCYRRPCLSAREYLRR